MDNLLDRYLDGELSDAEAEDLLRRLAAEPELAAELRAHESALAALVDVRARPADDFTDRVMHKVRAAAPDAISGPTVGEPTGRQRRSVFSVGPIRWNGWAVAATVALCFAAGFAAARFGAGIGDGPAPLLTEAPSQMQVTGPTQVTASGSPRLRTVRLVYMPQDSSVGSVAVAGDFNGWQPTQTPLVRRDGVWSTMLALPPATYEYMFVIDGERWVSDPLATGTRDDGFGGANAVLDLTL